MTSQTVTDKEMGTPHVLARPFGDYERATIRRFGGRKAVQRVFQRSGHRFALRKRVKTRGYRIFSFSAACGAK
jgi:hypothetical protein